MRLPVIDQLGRQSGLYDTYIRTDSQWITKQPVPPPARNAKNLNDFDAVFLFISGEGDWTAAAEEGFRRPSSRKMARASSARTPAMRPSTSGKSSAT